MAHRFIIDDSTGALYSDFTCRRLTSAADILKSERGLSPTLEIYLVNVATDTRAVTGQTLTNADLDIILGSAGKMPDEGIIKIAWNDSGTLYQSGYVDVKNLSDDAIAAAFNSVVSPVTDAEGINVDNIGEGKWLLTMKKVGAISGNPTFDVEGCNPPSAIEVSSVRTGDSDTKGQWIISIAQSPVASISGGSFSAVTSGSFSGLTASISLNTTAMIASISRGIKDFELSITHSNQLLHRSPVSIHESLDPTTAGTLIISSPSLFTLGSNAVNQGETIALSGGLTYDGTTLAAPFLPLAGGTMTGNAVFNDGVKAIFGTASDGIELYHASNESYIDDSGTGRLFIRSNGSGVFLQKTDGENLAKFKTDGATELYFDGSKKIESTNLGCTISGKLIVNGDLDVSGTTTTFNSTVVTVDDPVFTVGGDTAPDASDNKDRGIEFRYFRSGESAKVGFFGYDNSENAFTFLTDATNNSEVFSGTLGNLKVGSITGTNFYATQIRTENGSASFPSHSFTNDSDTGIFKAAGNTLAFSTGGTEAARFDSLGRLGINTQSPLGLLEISTSNVKTSVNAGADELILQNDGYCGLTIFSNSTSAGQIIFGDETSDVAGAIQYFNSDDSLRFKTNGTEAARFDSSGHFLIPDDHKIKFGDNQEYRIDYDSSGYAYHQNTSGPLFFVNTANDKDFIWQTTTGGTTSEILRLDASTGNVSIGSHIHLGDNQQIRFGTDSDLTIEHTGSDSVISDSSGTGGIKIDTNYLQIRNASGTESQAKFIENGAVELNYDNSKKLETTTDGISVTGKLDVGGVSYFGGGSTSGHTQDETDAALVLQDNFYIYSENGGGYLRNIIGKASTGPIIIGEAGTSIINEIRSYAGEAGLYTWHQGTTETMRLNSTGLGITEKLYHLNDDNTYLQFNTDQINLATDGIDRLRLELAAVKCGRDLRIAQGVGYSNFLLLSHNDSNAFVKNNFGDLYIENTANGKDTIFKNDNTSGTATELLRLDGSASSINVPDDVMLKVGSGGLSMEHKSNNETWNYYSSASGHAIYAHGGQDQDFIFKTTPSSTGSQTELLRLDGSTSSINVPDDISIKVGSSGDLTLYSNNANLHYDHYNLNTVFRHFGTDKDFIWYTTTGGTISEVLRLDGSTGNVGIGGVTSPSARLEITTASQGDTALQVGFTNSTPNLLVGTSTGSTKLEIANGNYHHKFYSRNASGTAVERLAIEGGSDTADIKIINSNLGIGTTSPNYLLDVESSGANMRLRNTATDATTQFVMRSGGSSGQNQIIFGDDDDANRGMIRYRHNGDSLAFEVADTEAMRIASDGDITQNYINYTDGSNYEALKISAESNHIKYDTTSIGSFSSNARGHRFNVNNTLIGRVESSGLWSYQNIYIEGAGSLRNASNHLNIATSTQTDNDIIFKPNDTEAVRITDTGRLGVGTSLPQTAMHLQFSGSDGLRIRSTSGDAYIYLSSANTTDKNNIIYFGDNDTSTVGAIQYDHNNDLIQFKTNGSNRLTLNSSGDAELLTDGKGLILSSPDGTRYKITVANGGAVTSTAM